MKENPYDSMLDIMTGAAKAQQKQGAQIGTIVNPPPNIKVSYRGFLLESPELYISEYLLTEYGRTARGHIVSATQNRAGGGGYAEYASHNHEINNDYTDSIIYTDTLKVGDKVTIFPILSEDGTRQEYVITDKIVRPDRRAF